MGKTIGKPNHCQCFPRFVIHFGAMLEFERKSDIFKSGQIAQQVVLLENNSELLRPKPGKFLLFHFGQIVIIYSNGAKVGLIQAGNEREKS